MSYGNRPITGFLKVTADGSGDYSTITEALTAAAAGGYKIEVAAGTYVEDIVIPDNICLKGVCGKTILTGSITANTTVGIEISGFSVNSTDTPAFTLTGNGVSKLHCFSGFHAQYSTNAADQSVISIDEGTLSISNTTLTLTNTDNTVNNVIGSAIRIADGTTKVIINAKDNIYKVNSTNNTDTYFGIYSTNEHADTTAIDNNSHMTVALTGTGSTNAVNGYGTLASNTNMKVYGGSLSVSATVNTSIIVTSVIADSTGYTAPPAQNGSVIFIKDYSLFNILNINDADFRTGSSTTFWDAVRAESLYIDSGSEVDRNAVVAILGAYEASYTNNTGDMYTSGGLTLDGLIYADGVVTSTSTITVTGNIGLSNGDIVYVDTTAGAVTASIQGEREINNSEITFIDSKYNAATNNLIIKSLSGSTVAGTAGATGITITLNGTSTTLVYNLALTNWFIK